MRVIKQEIYPLINISLINFWENSFIYIYIETNDIDNGFQSYEIFQRFGKYFEYKMWGSCHVSHP